ncbi:MAG: hypothetical protein QMB52_11575 [Propionivibrio sp.]
MDSEFKDEWLKSFQGATLRLPAEFGNPKVIHMFERAFNFLGRNAFYVSVRGRILLGEEQVSMAEQHIYNSIEEMTKAIDRQIEAAKAVMLDAGVSVMATYNKPAKLEAIIISPIQRRYLQLLHKADELFMLVNTLMLHGEMAEREHSKRELQIKHHMRTVPSTVRKITLGLRQRVAALQEKEAQKSAAEAQKSAAKPADAAEPQTDAAAVEAPVPTPALELAAA